MSAVMAVTRQLQRTSHSHRRLQTGIHRNAPSVYRYNTALIMLRKFIKCLHVMVGEYLETFKPSVLWLMRLMNAMNFLSKSSMWFSPHIREYFLCSALRLEGIILSCAAALFLTWKPSLSAKARFKKKFLQILSRALEFISISNCTGSTLRIEPYVIQRSHSDSAWIDSYEM